MGRSYHGEGRGGRLCGQQFAAQRAHNRTGRRSRRRNGAHTAQTGQKELQILLHRCTGPAAMRRSFSQK